MSLPRLLRTYSTFAPAKPLRIVPGLQTIEAYYQAIEDFEAHQYSESVGHLHRVLKALEAKQSGDHVSYAVAGTLLAKAQASQSLNPQAESTLATIVHRLSTVVDSHQELYTNACLNLLIHCVHANVHEAIRFGKKMQTPDLWRTLPVHARADWHFLVGVRCMQTAETLLGEDFIGAKKSFEIAQLEDSKELAPYLLNNLACAQWWHYMKFWPIKPKSAEKKQAFSDFDNCIPTLKKAISLFEGSAEPYELAHSLPTNKLCGVSLSNIAEIMVADGREDGLNWWKRTLEYYKAHDKKQLGRILVHLAGMFKYENKKKAEELILEAKKVLGKREDVVMAFAHEVHLKIMGTDPKREEESKALMQSLGNINAKVVPWAWPAAHMYIPEWHLI